MFAMEFIIKCIMFLNMIGKNMSPCINNLTNFRKPLKQFFFFNDYLTDVNINVLFISAKEQARTRECKKIGKIKANELKSKFVQANVLETETKIQSALPSLDH